MGGSKVDGRRWIARILSWAALVILVGRGLAFVHADVTQVRLVEPGTYGEDDDYFTTVWGNPRDMDDANDLYVIHSTCGPRIRPKWTDITMVDGVWQGTTSAAGESRWLTLLNPGWVSSLDVGQDGELRPIDTKRYTQLTFRMRLADGAGRSSPTVEWANGPIGKTVARGYKRFWVEGDGDWHVYTINLGLHPDWTSGPVSWLWFQFEPLQAGYRLEIDWVRLTPRPVRRITWQGTSLSGEAQVYLGPSASSPERYGDVRIYERDDAPQQINASARSLDVPASLPGGTYYGRVESGGVGVNSSTSWAFWPLPVAEILAPSMTSGRDFAAEMVGNSWDMAGMEDVDPAATEMDALRSLRVAEGVLTAVSKDDRQGDCSPDWPHRPLGLNLGGLRIDPNEYRYLSFRYRVEQAPDQGAGGVARVRWQAQHLAHWPTGRTDDISFYHDGWQTYHLDLATVRREGEEGSWGGPPEESFPVDTLQIILHESHREWTSHLDWVKLTAENEAGGSYLARWRVVGTSHPVTTTLQWAEVREGDYVLVAGSEQVVSRPPEPDRPDLSLGQAVALPLVMADYWRGGELELRYKMSTAGLVKGKAYTLAFRLEDGYNSSIWYSEVPVRVR
jgi:hypothetical protein